jgi:hypothetical protein
MSVSRLPQFIEMPLRLLRKPLLSPSLRLTRMPQSSTTPSSTVMLSMLSKSTRILLRSNSPNLTLPIHGELAQQRAPELTAGI